MTPELARRLEDPGYTPPVSTLGVLLAELESADDARAELLSRVAARAGVAAGVLALERLEGAPALLRERLLAVVGRVANPAHTGVLLEPLLAATQDPEPRCRRTAFRALGQLGEERAEPVLLAALGQEALPEQRAIVETLGKLGGPISRANLRSLHTSDAELARRAGKALALIERRLQRSLPAGGLVLDRALPRRVCVAALCRSGVAGYLAQELSSFDPRLVSEERVHIQTSSSLAELLLARTALEFGIVVDLERSRSDPAESVVNALADPRTLALLAAWTDGTPKFRLDWSDAGHQRALTWTVVRRLGERCPALLNDPRDATWVVRAAPGSGELLLVPRLQPDPRFQYRVRDVPGSSHPTIAAALARAASERPSRVVWDPFAGGGLELIERARLGPYERLIGTDLADDALRAATENLAAARVERVELIRADARSFAPANVDLILSNPPMGRRVLRDGSVAALLEAFVAHAARVLCPGGRVVWLSPLDRRTARAATSAGLSVRNGPNLDLGGFSARLQILEKPASRGL